jgi:phage baseplate assembly protein V
MNLPDFKRLIHPISNKIFLMLARGILKAVDNSQGTQMVQITALEGETITDMERFQEYGFETFAKSGAEPFAAFLNGNRDHGIVLCMHDRRYRPKDLVEGEVAIYTDEDKTTPTRVHFKRGRICFLRVDKMQIVADTEAYINSSKVMLGSDTWASVRKLVDERFQTLFNNHTHQVKNVQGGNATLTSEVPASTLTNSHMTDYTRAV